MNKLPYNFKTVKSILLLAALAIFLIMPEHVLHTLFGLLHLFYEVMAMIVEEWLHHAFDLTKHQSQLIVFYGSWSAVLVLSYHVYNRIPKWLNRGKEAFNLQKERLIGRWQAFDIWTKTKWMLIQCAGVIGFLIFMVN